MLAWRSSCKISATAFPFVAKPGRTRVGLSLMYEQFFGLRERPFDLVPNPRFLYLSQRGREAVANLRYGLAFPRGLTLLLGDAGTGKTTLVSQVVSEIDPRRVQCVLLSNPTLTRNEFYEMLTEGFGLAAEAIASKPK